MSAGAAQRAGGSGRIAVRSAVVAGGSGFLGRHLVAGAVRAGWTVVVPTRRPETLVGFVAALGDAPGAVHVVPLAADRATSGEGADGDPYEGAAGRVRELVPDVSVVVAAIGGWSIGPRLLDLSLDAWRTAVDDHLTSHVRAAQAYVPLLEGVRDPVYVMLNGAAADGPMVGSGAISVTGAAQRMLLDVLRAEQRGRRVRFHEVTVTAAVAGDERNLDPAAEVSAAAVADVVLGVAADPEAPDRLRVGP